MSALRSLAQLELIESRLLLSFASLSSHGTLSVAGTGGNDSITVQVSGTKVQAILNGQTLSFNKGDAKRIFAEGFGGNDRMKNKTNLPSTLIGDAGNDSLTGGTGNDSLDGGDGNDTADYSARTAPVTAEVQVDQANSDPIGGVGGFGGQSGEHDVYRSINTIVGGSGNDSLSVRDLNRDAGPNIAGLSFLLDGRNGNDFFFNNSLENLATAMGGNGNDHFSFRGQQNTLLGGAGNDFFTNDDSDDDAVASIDGGSGTDTEEYGGVGEITINMGANLENFISHNVNVNGNDLNNVIDASGSGSDVKLNGGGGNDKIVGGAGNDIIHGGSGNDTVTGGTGSDDIFGDGGSDTDDDSSRGFALNISLDNIANDGPRSHPEEVDNVHSDIETVLGGSGNDKIIGNPFANKLVGNAGNDTIFGGDGNDTLIGGPGTDQLDGQGGNDVVTQ